jgi:mevalonate pyrophosphate decarboxylase
MRNTFVPLHNTFVPLHSILYVDRIGTVATATEDKAMNKTELTALTAGDRVVVTLHNPEQTYFGRVEAKTDDNTRIIVRLQENRYGLEKLSVHMQDVRRERRKLACGCWESDACPHALAHLLVRQPSPTLSRS